LKYIFNLNRVYMVSFIAINNFFIMPHSFALINNHIEL
jgi:hypothetical protein